MSPVSPDAPSALGQETHEDLQNLGTGSPAAVPTRFRFKDKHRRRRSPERPSSRSRSRSPASSTSHRHRHRHHQRRRHHHGRHRSRKTSPSSTPPYDTETAFRLSLFDAMADDEGAAFWEGVYGQPIHTYANMKAGPDGELERMTEEEYTAYVRRKMWEKSTEGIEEERQARIRERRQREREEEAQEQQRERAQAGAAGQRPERNIFDIQVEESLQRGERRKREKAWKQRWEEYLSAWNKLNAVADQFNADSADATTASQLQSDLRGTIAWPVESGRSKDINSEEVERFFRKATSASSTEPEDPRFALMTALKTERVRWHPDKIQQRFSKLGIDDDTLKRVTSVFQIVDRMWNEERGKV